VAHHISAVLLRGPFDAKLSQCFDLRPISLAADLTLFPLTARYVDYWAERLGIPENRFTGPLLNFDVVHHMIRRIAPEPLFAVIETDYFGGRGTQSAAVYRGEAEVTPGESAGGGPINRALRLLGVVAVPPKDEFDTVGLGSYRNFYQVFGEYEGPT
jgi:hypothetical protein